jgi:hypothetical protein
MTTTELFKVTHTDEEWRRLLTLEQYQVMRAQARRSSVFRIHRRERSLWSIQAADCSPVA